ncbi:LysR family transcriptional regulator [Shinella yambaruensis]|uniref:LysR family transcriptional regulator n=1 Tax=Shinella yambaruensis TaxID=415996 RepID=A0ABQ5ZS27_9HYPH|nr:LysR family transcriptional regulator [Shinella yambaruensis]MCJ8028375.1 LysR family transcriptional regulator [Shinella yambaruensis]MCU7981428.1 LysR family transcriptional regulator [Shinella yambaruensis]GLR53542.1 LysR family transcriptional regulator [Shinella yambaruensis]
MDRVEMMRVFVRVVETGSFSEAARLDGVAQSTVSKKVAGLETHLGAELLDRSTNRTILTPDGQDFYISAKQVLNHLREAEERVALKQFAPSGNIRLSLSSGFGRLCVVPRLKEFLVRYPDLSIDLNVMSQLGANADHGADVEIRVGVAVAPETRGEFIGHTAPITVATRAYLALRGEPLRPSELAQHECIGWTVGGNPVAWDFQGPRGSVTVMPSGSLRTNDADCVRAAVLSDLGIGYGPQWLFAEEIASGEVRSLLADYATAKWPISAVCPKDRRVPSRVRVLIDFLSEAFSDGGDRAYRRVEQ